MRTSILALVLSSVAPVMAHAQAQSPSWQTDYAEAQAKAAAKHKPMAIVFGQGQNGWQQLGGGTLSNEASRVLADKYVTCYVDTATPAGRALAQRFEMNSSVGLVISDCDANLQAFWHEGTLSADVLNTYLLRYSDPQRPVTSTDINPGGARTSYYPPTGLLGNNPYTPVAYPGMMGGSMTYPGGTYCPTCSGGSCASGNCGRRR